MLVMSVLNGQIMQVVQVAHEHPLPALVFPSSHGTVSEKSNVIEGVHVSANADAFRAVLFVDELRQIQPFQKVS